MYLENDEHNKPRYEDYDSYEEWLEAVEEWEYQLDMYYDLEEEDRKIRESFN